MDIWMEAFDKFYELSKATAASFLSRRQVNKFSEPETLIEHDHNILGVGYTGPKRTIHTNQVN